MITYAPNNMKYARPTMALNGLSTDEKPTQRHDGRCIPNGSTFYEIDTGLFYMYDAEANIWYYQINYNNDMNDLFITDYTVDNNGFVLIRYVDRTCFVGGWKKQAVM